MGVNLHQSVEDFEQGGLYDATSLFAEAGYAPDCENLLISFLKHFKPLYMSVIDK